METYGNHGSSGDDLRVCFLPPDRCDVGHAIRNHSVHTQNHVEQSHAKTCSVHSLALAPLII